MGRLIPLIILFSLVALAFYAGLQSFSLAGKKFSITGVSLPSFLSRSTPEPTPESEASPPPKPTPHPGINSYLQTHLLNASSTCVHRLLDQDNNYYYLWAICKNPDASLSIPVALSLDLSDHRIPKAGESYSSDLENIFPASVLSNDIFSDPSLLQDLQQKLL